MSKTSPMYAELTSSEVVLNLTQDGSHWSARRMRNKIVRVDGTKRGIVCLILYDLVIVHFGDYCTPAFDATVSNGCQSV